MAILYIIIKSSVAFLEQSRPGLISGPFVFAELMISGHFSFGRGHFYLGFGHFCEKICGFVMAKFRVKTGKNTVLAKKNGQMAILAILKVGRKWAENS